MESLNIQVQTIFLDKHKYKDIDYIRIMNQLKEKYLKLVQTKEQPKWETLDESYAEQQVDNESEYAEQQEESDLEYDSDGYENYFSSY